MYAISLPLPLPLPLPLNLSLSLTHSLTHAHTLSFVGFRTDLSAHALNSCDTARSAPLGTSHVRQISFFHSVCFFPRGEGGEREEREREGEERERGRGERERTHARTCKLKQAYHGAYAIGQRLPMIREGERAVCNRQVQKRGWGGHYRVKRNTRARNNAYHT